MYVCIYICIHMCVYIYQYIFVCVCVCVCIYVGKTGNKLIDKNISRSSVDDFIYRNICQH